MMDLVRPSGRTWAVHGKIVYPHIGTGPQKLYSKTENKNKCFGIIFLYNIYLFLDIQSHRLPVDQVECSHMARLCVRKRQSLYRNFILIYLFLFSVFGLQYLRDHYGLFWTHILTLWSRRLILPLLCRAAHRCRIYHYCYLIVSKFI